MSELAHWRLSKPAFPLIRFTPKSGRTGDHADGQPIPVQPSKRKLNAISKVKRQALPTVA